MQVRRRWFAPILVATLALTACTDQAEDPREPIVSQSINPVDRNELAPGGELRIAVANLGQSFNPLQSPGVGKGATAYLPSFFDFDETGAATPDPDFVTSVDAAGDPTVVTINLNPKATWGDGDPISWQDVAATVAACQDTIADVTCATDQFTPIASVARGTSDQQVIVTFNGVYPDWASVFRGVSTLRAESVKDAATFNQGWSEPRSEWLSGPFTFDRFDSDANVVTWVPNPDWWGETPLLQRLTFRQVAPDAAAAAYLSNQIDVFHIGIDPEGQSRAQGAADGEVRTAASGDARTLLFNTRSGPLADPEVRKAIVTTLDRDAIANSDLAGMDWQPRALNSHVWVENDPNYADMAETTGIVGPDADKARLILDEAGWTAAEDGTRSKDGTPLQVSFTVVKGMKASESEGKQIKEMLKSVGIEVTLEVVELEKFTTDELMTTGDFQMLAYTEPGSAAPMSTFAERYLTDSPSNWTGWSSPELQDLVDQIAVTSDPQARVELARQADELLWQAAPSVPLYQLPDSVAVKRNLANYGAFGLGTPDWTKVGFVSQ